ncbi:MAG: hypothetical protein H7145_00320 [Akkermansiaceae bacterium]|nr:hypothetical protein [Armatimonadota bacterium]
MVTRVIKSTRQVVRRKYFGFSLKEAMQPVPTEQFTKWALQAVPLPPSAMLQEMMSRFESFDLTGSEPAKILLINAVLLEIVPRHPKLKVWKGEPLETDTLSGFADYLIAPKRAYVDPPLLCVTGVKKDDFEGGEVQCVAEMVACRRNNEQSGLHAPVHGIVSNGQVWQFYRLSLQNTVDQSRLFTMEALPDLLGALDHVCEECAKAAS